MQEAMSIGTNIATLVAVVVWVVSGIVIAYAGFQYATAMGVKGGGKTYHCGGEKVYHRGNA